MGVEAARNALRRPPGRGLARPQTRAVRDAEPAYLDKTNATAIHAALGLPSSVAAIRRRRRGAVRDRRDAPPTRVRRADARRAERRPHRPARRCRRAGRRRRRGRVRDGRARPGAATPQLRPLGAASASLEFLDRWRLPGEPASHVWEERFGEHVYVPLVQDAFTDACKAAGIGPDALDHVIVTGAPTRARLHRRPRDRRRARRARRRPRVHGRQHRYRARRAAARGRARTGRAGPAHRRRAPSPTGRRRDLARPPTALGCAAAPGARSPQQLAGARPTRVPDLPHVARLPRP